MSVFFFVILAREVSHVFYEIKRIFLKLIENLK